MIEYDRLTSAIISGDANRISDIVSSINTHKLQLVIDRACELDDIEIIKSIVSVLGEFGKKSAPIESAIRWGRVDIVKFLLPISDIHESDALIEASYSGFIDIMHLIIDKGNIELYDYEAIVSAIWAGNEDIVELLLSHTTLDQRIWQVALETACSGGKLKIVEILIDKYKYKPTDNEALKLSIRSNNLELVELIIPFYEQEDVNVIMVDCAINNQNDFIDLLFDKCDPHKVKEEMVKKYSTGIYFMQKYEAWDTKRKLVSEIMPENMCSGIKKSKI